MDFPGLIFFQFHVYNQKIWFNNYLTFQNYTCKEKYSMTNHNFQQAFENQSDTTVHLVSGEFYQGICQKNDSSTFKMVTNENQTITIPYWTVKRAVTQK